MEPPPVFFMHVPKTAGTALGKWLKSAYRPADYLDVDIPQLAQLDLHKLRAYRCYHSWHIGRTLFDFIGRSDLPVVTMLRDPIERSVSAYYHHQRYVTQNAALFTSDYLEKLRPMLNTPINDCPDLEHMVISQTAYLGNRRDYPAFLKRIWAAGDRGPFLRPLPLDNPVDPNDQTWPLSNAIAWLDEMAVVGLTERYADSLLLIGDLLGIPVPTKHARVNANPDHPAGQRYRDRLTPRTLEQLNALNRLDLELYAHACRRFETQWARWLSRPHRTFSMAPRIRSVIHQAKQLRGDLRRKLTRRAPPPH